MIEAAQQEGYWGAVTTMQDLLQQMSAGMGVALYTTLTGVVASMVLGLQYLLLDRSADQLVAGAVQFGEFSTMRG